MVLARWLTSSRLAVAAGLAVAGAVLSYSEWTAIVESWELGRAREMSVFDKAVSRGWSNRTAEARVTVQVFTGELVQAKTQRRRAVILLGSVAVGLAWAAYRRQTKPLASVAPRGTNR